MPSSCKQLKNAPSRTACAADACKTEGKDLAVAGTPTERGDFIDQTIAIWQKRTERRLTREDGREIIENISGFFSILQEWDQRERAAECAKAALSQKSNVGQRARRSKCRG
jgi:hypothetical protein